MRNSPYRIPAESPYRIPAKMPKEKEIMSDTIRIWKMALTAIVVITVLITAHSIFTTFQTNQMLLEKARIENTETARGAAQARAQEAKALSDRAMFEQMKK